MRGRDNYYTEVTDYWSLIGVREMKKKVHRRSVIDHLEKQYSTKYSLFIYAEGRGRRL